MAKQKSGKGPGPKRHTKKKASRRVQNAFEIALAEEAGGNNESGSESEDDGAIVNPRKFIVNNEGRRGDGEGEEFEDEEIDSDEAMGSDDDYDVLNSKFSQTIRDQEKKKKQQKKDKKNKEIIDEESEEDDDDGGYASVDESQFVGLSEAWDMDDMNKSSGKDLVLDDNWESESEEEDDEDSEDNDEDSEEEEEESDAFPDEVEEDSETELTTLKKSLSKLAPSLKTKKHYESSAIKENELSLPGGGSSITLSDMLSVVDPTISKSAILINRDLENTDDPELADANKPLSIPLPQRLQQRNERKAAYEITKEELDKWSETVRDLKKADVLQFPLQQDEEPAPLASTFDDIEKPVNDLENRINSILTESKLIDENAESKFEEIQTAKLSKNELQKRQAELRKMRELMFRQEREAKRIKKIKSKSYRRIKKKELLKTQQLVGELEGDLDQDGDDEDHDMRRAQERMSLKHKNNSKWAQRMIKSGMSKDSEARGEMEEMLARGERLKAKILDRDEGDLDEFGDTNDLNIDREADDANDDEELEKVGKTGVLNMAFMRNAEARESIANEEYKNKLRKLNRDEDIEEFEKELEGEGSGVDVVLNGGRRIYTPGSLDTGAEMREVAEDVLNEEEIDSAKSLNNRISGKTSSRLRSNPLSSTMTESSTKQETAAAEEESNPWLSTNDEDPSILKSRKIKIVDETSSRLDKSAAKISKKRKASTLNKEDGSKKDDELIDMNETLRIVDPYAETADTGDASDDDSNIRMFKQTDLIKQAFAGDDVVSEFQEEKSQVARDEGDQIEDLTMPGWGGDWAGGSTNKRRKNNKKKILKVTKGIDPEQRKDKKLKNVIINEKHNKKNAKYQSTAVPFPFENREQYERSLRMPIGQEWTSRESHQRLTMPKVIAKRGVVIDPFKKPNK